MMHLFVVIQFYVINLARTKKLSRLPTSSNFSNVCTTSHTVINGGNVSEFCSFDFSHVGFETNEKKSNKHELWAASAKERESREHLTDRIYVIIEIYASLKIKRKNKHSRWFSIGFFSFVFSFFIFLIINECFSFVYFMRLVFFSPNFF